MKEITVPARLDQLTEVTAWMDEALEALDCPPKAQMQMDMAIDEIFGNIAHYAYPDGDGSATVQLDFDEAQRVVSLVFIDRGQPFDPLKKPDPDTTLAAEERKIGGLGIFLVKKIMDEVNYCYRDGQNILTVRKKLG